VQLSIPCIEHLFIVKKDECMLDPHHASRWIGQCQGSFLVRGEHMLSLLSLLPLLSLLSLLSHFLISQYSLSPVTIGVMNQPKITFRIKAF
jgi:hypothetical protein